MRISPPANLFLLLVTLALAAPATAQTPVPATRDPDFARGQTDGSEAARSVSTRGWAASGLVGGLVLGPVGTAVVVTRAGRSEVQLPAGQPPALQAEPIYLDGFRRGFHDAVRERRRESVLVGGIIGTTVFAFAVIKVVGITGREEGTGSEPPPPAFSPVPY